MGSPVPEDEQDEYDEEKYDLRLERAMMKLDLEEQRQKSKAQADQPKATADQGDDDEYEESKL